MLFSDPGLLSICIKGDCWGHCQLLNQGGALDLSHKNGRTACCEEDGYL